MDSTSVKGVVNGDGTNIRILEGGAKNETADAAKAVDANRDDHCF